MNVFVGILMVILGIAFVGFFGYEVYCLVRDIKKHRASKKNIDDKNTPNNK